MSANVVSIHLVAHYQRFTRQVQYLTGNYFFKWPITMLIWFCLYKSLEITMIKIHFSVYRLFVLDASLCWNKWKITVVKLGCMWTELLSKECKTTCYVIVNWQVHIWNSRLLQQKCTPRKGLSFIYFHALAYSLLWLVTAVTTSATKYLLFVW